MTKLSDFLKQHLDATSRAQKDVSGAFHTELVSRGGKELSMNTIEPKLSKLLSGSEEGARFFLDDAQRLAALASAVGVSEEEILRLRGVRTLVLDPRLDKGVAEYLRARAESPDARHACVSAADRDELRRMGKERVGCLVVLADLSDRAFFEGADVDFTTVSKHPRGWLLEKHPELVPLPPAPPPQLFLGDQPMIPSDLFAEEVRKDLSRRGGWRLDIDKRLADAEERGEVPTFPLREVGPLLAGRARKNAISWGNPPTLLWNFQTAEPGWDPEITFVWTKNRQLFVTGPEAEWVRSIAAPYHEAHGLTCLDPLRDAIARWNPWARLPPDPDRREATPEDAEYQALARALGDEGLDLKLIVKGWRAHRDPEHAKKEWSLSLADEAAQEVARAGLVSLLRRKFSLEAAQQMFRLHLALSAELATIEREPGDLLHVVANLGAGHVIRVRALEYPHEAPTTLQAQRVNDGSDLDGGDVHIFIRDLGDDVALEASPMPALRRREDAWLDAARRRQEEEADDD
ncbi:MAG: hypothetical protein IPM79_16755 [Polyangiaceae bacterium]|nr:hypothetical protein [Polyangiaceae bacterium]